MTVSIFGLGYVGCVSLGCLAQNGFNVIGIDVSQQKIDLINSGLPTIIEKDVDKLILEHHKSGKIRATGNYLEAVIQSDVSIICVGTPSKPEGHLNLDYIFNTAKQIGESIKNKKDFHVIIIRSTVMPGTNNKYAEIVEEISGKKNNIDFAVVSNPEFLREGSAVADYYNPPYTLLGTENDKAFEIASKLYQSINAPILRVEIKVAELIKYVNNSFHALKVAFGNEIGNICKKLSINSHELIEIFLRDTKLNISEAYLRPGLPYGGSCLPKDLKGLNTIAYDNYLKVPVLEAVEYSNSIHKNILLELIENLGSKNVGILGLSFKSGTDDLRYSPMLELAEKLLGKGYHLNIYDEKVKISRLIGANKNYLETHLPHLNDLIDDNIEKMIDASKVIIISQKIDGLINLIERNSDKIFVDCVNLKLNKNYSNVIGLCW